MQSFKQYITEVDNKYVHAVENPKIVLIGGPGSGKSTYAKFLVKEFNIKHIYPGDLLRAEKSKGGDIADRLSDLGKGGFAPNDIVLNLVFNAVAEAKGGYVFDGFPRYMQQVRDLQQQKHKHKQCGLSKRK